LTKIEIPHSILSLKQHAQRTEKKNTEGCKRGKKCHIKVNLSKSQQISQWKV
jgi:hypothetical protein